MSTIIKNYQTVLKNINSIAASSGRDPASIQLLTVTKNHSWTEIEPLYQAGCQKFGENRVQEALEKMENAPNDIDWQFIGTLQKNKVRKVVGKFSLIHSVDTHELVEKISNCSAEQGIDTKILLEVNTSGELSKHGFSPEDLKTQYQKLLKLPNIHIQGLMTMAPLTEDQQLIRNTFRQLRILRDELASASPQSFMQDLSMGMSHDYSIAIEEGATILRIGSAIFS
jgi:PLP dependent protein